MTLAILDEGTENEVVRNLELERKGKTPKGTKHVLTHRRTLSGTVVPLGHHLPTWHDLVQPQPETEYRERTGAFYDAMKEIPTPSSLVEVLIRVPASYRHRRAYKGSYTRALHRNLGQAWVAAKHARRLKREQERARQLGPVRYLKATDTKENAA